MEVDNGERLTKAGRSCAYAELERCKRGNDEKGKQETSSKENTEKGQVNGKA